MRKQLIYILTFFILISCVSETRKRSEKQNLSINETSKILVDSIPESINKIDYSDSTNFTDSNGWKQGKWIRKWKGKLVEKYTYVNDTLNGHYETNHGEGYYKNGQKDGLQFSYYGKKESILMVSYYNNGNASGADFLLLVEISSYL